MGGRGEPSLSLPRQTKTFAFLSSSATSDSGRPIISTSLGAEALPLRAGEHYLHAEDAEGFAAAVRELRAELVEHSPAVVARLAAARAAVAHLTWPQIADELAEVYRTSVR